MTAAHPHPTTSHPPRPERRARSIRTDIQALRGLAVAAVLGYHFAPTLLPGGYVGVDIFFVISGFVITSLMLTEVDATGTLSMVRFYARRARRILPAATATIIATAAVGLVVLPLNRWENLAQDAFYTAIYGQNWHLAVTSVDYLAGGGAPSPMQHFWSLAIEEQFYFLWPAVLLGAFALVGRRSVRLAATLVLVPTIALTFLAAVAAVERADPAAYFATHTRAWQLAVGALLAVCWPAVNRLTGNTAGALEPGGAPRTASTWILLAGGAGLIAFALVTYSAATPFPGAAALAPTLGTAALIAAAAPGGRWVNAAPVQWLGNVSYSLYLVHWPVAIFLPKTLPEPLWALAALGLSLLLAGVSFTHIEQGLATRFTRPFLAGAMAMGVGVAVAGATLVTFTHQVTELDEEAQELLQTQPEGFGAGSISAEGYTPLLPGTRGTAPSRAKVREDLPPSYDDGCVGETTAPATPECEYGDMEGEETWVLVGDSHMDQYLPALEPIAADEGIRLVTFFHANCPFNTAQTVGDLERGGPCRAANAQTAERINNLAPDLIITSNWSDIDWAGDPVTGFAEAWADLPAPVVVIADNPAMDGADATTECVVENFPTTDPCAKPRTEALPTDHQLPAAERAASAGVDVAVLDLTGAYCTAEDCPPVIGNVMVYRDPHHITETYMRTLAPRLTEELTRVLGQH